MKLADYQKRDFQYLLISFSLPVMFVFLGYLIIGIYPFGDNTILVMDLHGQYFPMINNLKSAMEDGNLLYSFSAGLGFNMVAQSAYYTNSIFWYIIALLPKHLMIPAFQFIVAIKFGLAGLAFAYFLRGKSSAPSILNVALSCAYALCGYSLAYLAQTMWTDAIFLFPLVMAGLERLLELRRPLLYYFSVSLLLISNFYIGYCVCIFTAIYFLVYEFSEKRKWKDRLKRTGIFALYSLLSGLTSAAFLIPTYLAIKLTKASDMGFEGQLEFYHSFEEVIEKLFPFSGSEHEFGVPNIYCGLFILICVFLYALNKNIPLRRRLLHLSLFTFLMLSFELNILDFIWHGFHYPNQLPGRYSFIFAFLALFMAYETLSNIKDIKKYKIIIALIPPISIMVYMISSQKREDNLFIVALIILFMYAVVLLASFKSASDFTTSILAMLIVFEIGSNALYIFSTDTRTYSHKYYTLHYDEMQDLTKKYESGKDDFWRSESTPYLSFNSGQLFDHKGINYYSSMMSGAAYDFFGKLGFGIYAKNVTTMYSPTPVVNSMLGVKYVYDRYENAKLSTLEAQETQSSTTVRENKYFLPVAFMVDENMLNFGSEKYNGPLEYQNALFSATGATEKSVFELQNSEAILNNATITFDADGNKYYYRTDSSSSVVCTFTCTTETEGDYYMTSAFRAGTMKLYVNGVQQKELSTSFYKLFFLGNYPAGTTIKITLTSDYSYALYGMEFYKFNEETFSKGYNKLLPGAVDVISSSPTKIKATVNAKQDGLLYTSIPNDGGWRIYIDGKKSAVEKIDDFLCCTKVNAGEHTVEFRYSPPGFYLGLVISVVSISAFATIQLIGAKRRKNKEGHII